MTSSHKRRHVWSCKTTLPCPSGVFTRHQRVESTGQSSYIGRTTSYFSSHSLLHIIFLLLLYCTQGIAENNQLRRSKTDIDIIARFHLEKYPQRNLVNYFDKQVRLKKGAKISKVIRRLRLWQLLPPTLPKRSRSISLIVSIIPDDPSRPFYLLSVHDSNKQTQLGVKIFPSHTLIFYEKTYRRLEYGIMDARVGNFTNFAITFRDGFIELVSNCGQKIHEESIDTMKVQNIVTSRHNRMILGRHKSTRTAFEGTICQLSMHRGRRVGQNYCKYIRNSCQDYLRTQEIMGQQNEMLQNGPSHNNVIQTYERTNSNGSGLVLIHERDRLLPANATEEKNGAKRESLARLQGIPNSVERGELENNLRSYNHAVNAENGFRSSPSYPNNSESSSNELVMHDVNEDIRWGSKSVSHNETLPSGLQETSSPDRRSLLHSGNRDAIGLELSAFDEVSNVNSTSNLHFVGGYLQSRFNKRGINLALSGSTSIHEKPEQNMTITDTNDKKQTSSTFSGNSSNWSRKKNGSEFSIVQMSDWNIQNASIENQATSEAISESYEMVVQSTGNSILDKNETLSSDAHTPVTLEAKTTDTQDMPEIANESEETQLIIIPSTTPILAYAVDMHYDLQTTTDPIQTEQYGHSEETVTFAITIGQISYKLPASMMAMLLCNDNAGRDVQYGAAVSAYCARRGPKGEMGPRGITGQPGRAGRQGRDGIPGAYGIYGRPGSPGYSGPKGKKGHPASFGRSGFKGKKGDSGDTGPVGMPGLAGRPGDDGKPGPRGKTGYLGAPGRNGRQGATGSPGRQGKTGPAGIPGLTGPEGEIGVAGLPGLPGLSGTNGGVGLEGKPGMKGVLGPPGATGLMGEPGRDGLPGLTGMPGKLGLRGPKGDRGQEGPRGLVGVSDLKGHPGDPGLPGSKGSKGVQGAKGSKGNKGDKGFHGDPGPIGPQGKAGRRGCNGTIGEQGPSGLPGAPGMQGVRGHHGKQGESIPGEKGFPGQRGENGLDGKRGLPGDYGYDGSSGPIGVKGRRGRLGGEGKIGKPGQKGNKGDEGRPGPTGIKGLHGLPGLRGQVGIDGPKGNRGEQGKVGLLGGKGQTGHQGIDGPPGSIGSPGPSGTPGIPGLPGTIGETGLPGPLGKVGKEGERGQPGKSGMVGNQGAEGEQGGQGEEGTKGDSGPPGYLGERGGSGSEGDNGPVGYKGEDGPAGAEGEIGELGPPGQDGPPGMQGPPGENGARGDKGEPGAPGIIGRDGISGSDGRPGDSGEPGDNGRKGKTGDPGEKGEGGATGDIGASGTPGPIGPQGFQGHMGKQMKSGPPGDRGRKGEKGVQGHQGRIGLPGAKGRGGEIGLPGLKGKRGHRGPQGNLGEVGSFGKEGLNGFPGQPGPVGHLGNDGSSGQQGAEGTPGEDGDVGEPGHPGPVGYRGVGGKPGDPGENGSKGPSGATGPDGERGRPGHPGGRGKPGVQGERGEHGHRGKKGDTGSRGAAGAPGVVGPPGHKGKQGGRGRRGERGRSGDPGLDGSSGLRGSRGESGLRGNAGTAGPSGHIGLPGEPGEKGIPGKKGLPGEPGSRGTLGLRGWAGVRGQYGPLGETGYAGLPGEPGERGAMGFKGVRGDKGIGGDEGIPGRPGSSGPRGLYGPKGMAGEIGLPGSKGVRGIAGWMGSAGPTGVPGAQGQPGLPGPPGPPGPNRYVFAAHSETMNALSNGHAQNRYEDQIYVMQNVQPNYGFQTNQWGREIQLTLQKLRGSIHEKLRAGGWTKQNPAADCQDVKLSYSGFGREGMDYKLTNGIYWIDPNGGCVTDAFPVQCFFNTNALTCVAANEFTSDTSDQDSDFVSGMGSYFARMLERLRWDQMAPSRYADMWWDEAALGVDTNSNEANANMAWSQRNFLHLRSGGAEQLLFIKCRDSNLWNSENQTTQEMMKPSWTLGDLKLQSWNGNLLKHTLTGEYRSSQQSLRLSEVLVTLLTDECGETDGAWRGAILHVSSTAAKLLPVTNVVWPKKFDRSRVQVDIGRVCFG